MSAEIITLKDSANNSKYPQTKVEAIYDADGHPMEGFKVADNLTTNDSTKALSAAQGVVLDGKISQLGQEINGTPNYNTGYYLVSDGEQVQDANYCTSDYIPIDAAIQTSGIIVIYGTYKADARIVFYDENKNYLDAKGEISGATQRTHCEC